VIAYRKDARKAPGGTFPVGEIGVARRSAPAGLVAEAPRAPQVPGGLKYRDRAETKRQRGGKCSKGRNGARDLGIGEEEAADDAEAE